MPHNDSALTVVLVHGGLTEASVWTPVVAQFRAEGVAITTAAGLAGSHATPLSQPTAVVDVILTAVNVLR